MASFQYVTLQVPRASFQELKDWYLDHIGLTIMWESGDFVLLVGSAGARVGFHVGEPLEQPDKVQLHFAVEDVDGQYRRLKSEGLVFVHAPKDMDWGYRMASLRDPVGHTVELYTEISNAQ